MFHTYQDTSSGKLFIIFLDEDIICLLLNNVSYCITRMKLYIAYTALITYLLSKIHIVFYQLLLLLLLLEEDYNIFSVVLTVTLLVILCNPT